MVNGYIVNKPGKFRCRCNDGFFEANYERTNLTDRNKFEGDNGGSNCDINADCLKIDGGSSLAMLKPSARIQKVVIHVHAIQDTSVMV